MGEDPEEKNLWEQLSEKVNAILANRQLMGSTDPKKAEEGTIRKEYGLSID